jgi:hypothetical protein
LLAFLDDATDFACLNHRQQALFRQAFSRVEDVSKVEGVSKPVAR